MHPGQFAFETYESQQFQSVENLASLTMLHAIPHGRDAGHEHIIRNSVAALEDGRKDGKYHLLLAASGSVATIKIVQIVKGLAKHENLSIRLIFTQSATHFLAGQSKEQPTLSGIGHMPNVDAVYTDASEWAEPWKRGAPILHINLRRWADVLVVAPLSADTMAKIVNGLCDNLLTSVIRAWDVAGAIDGVKKKIILAPSMNTAMWNHPITANQVKTLQETWGGDDGWFELLLPISRSMACGDVGDGAMVLWDTVVKAIDDKIAEKKSQGP